MSAILSAIEKAMSGKEAFCKLLSPNDSGETGGHQAGFLISKSARNMLFTDEELKEHIAKKNVQLYWMDNFVTEGCFTWYESKNELRVTRFTKGFPFIGPEYTGALFVLIKNTEQEYDAYIFNTEDEINEFLDAFGITPAETNRPIKAGDIEPSERERIAIDEFIEQLVVEFPSSEEMSHAARVIAYAVHLNKSAVLSNPDKILLEWTEEEFRLFKALEYARYGPLISDGFDSVDDFVTLANKVLNRRKSRAGKSLEHHLAAIFDGNNIQYTAQAVTEGNKKPDFIFPSQEAYHDYTFPTSRLISLAAKTTCKDRWRQVINEADRLRNGNKYLCTLQQGISAAQMDEMQQEKVILVVPKPYIKTYPKDRQERIWTIGRFVQFVKDTENM